jgi:hypothetical protein
MATAAKFTAAEKAKLFAQLEVPFGPAQIRWRVMRASDDGRKGAVIPFADPRAYRNLTRKSFSIRRRLIGSKVLQAKAC